MKDYYKTLGVNPSSGPAEIKKAYRRMAFKYHPDKNPGNNLSEAYFKEVQEAYTTLCDARRKAEYDDERWLSGMGGKTSYTEAVTPEWLLAISMKLNDDLATMDTYRMSQSALQAYILMILADAHLGVLQRDGDKEVKHRVIMEILKAIEKLDTAYYEEIINRLNLLADGDKEAAQAVYRQTADKKKAELQKKLFPYIVLLITLALCLFMYLYAGWKF